MVSEMIEGKQICIDGLWVPASGREVLTLTNPATDSSLRKPRSSTRRWCSSWRSTEGGRGMAWRLVQEMTPCALNLASSSCEWPSQAP